MANDQFDNNLRRVDHGVGDIEPAPVLAATRLSRSPMTLARPLTAAAVGLVISAMAFGVYWARSGPAALPSGQPLTVVTVPVARPGAPCLLALLSGAEMKRSGSEVVFSGHDGHDIAITWPFGTTARLVNGEAELFAPNGTLVASEGQTLPDLTGGLGVDDRFHVCEVGSHS